MNFIMWLVMVLGEKLLVLDVGLVEVLLDVLVGKLVVMWLFILL